MTVVPRVDVFFALIATFPMFPIDRVGLAAYLREAVTKGVQIDMTSVFSATRWYPRHQVCPGDLRVPGSGKEGSAP